MANPSNSDLRRRGALEPPVKQHRRAQQRKGMGVSRAVEDVVARAHFDDAPLLHDGHAVCKLLDRSASLLRRHLRQAADYRWPTDLLTDPSGGTPRPSRPVPL